MAKRYDISEQRRARAGQSGRGREAERPREIPKPGWRDVLMRTKSELNRDNVGLVAAGVAFYALLAIFPAIAAVISVYGLVADPADVERQMSSLLQVIPQEAAGILRQQMENIASQPTTGLGFGVLFGVLLAIWSASKGTKALMQGLNIANDEEESRGFFKLNATALGLTAGGIVFAAIALGLIAVLPALLGNLGLPSVVQTAVSLLRWPLLLVAVMVGLGVAYRYGPSRDKPQWRWLSWGAGIATAAWLVGSILFSVYVSNFGSYGETYGSVGAVVVLMMWFYLSAYVALLGAELNAEMERQTRRDTTVGTSEPMGRRDAHAADTLGRSP
jgi:membrane protein